MLDSRDGVRTGGETGPSIQPGKPDDSLLIKAVRYSDDNVKMPPKGKLPDHVIADVEIWVKRGAADPRTKGTATKSATSWKETMRERAGWWSLQPVSHPVFPSGDNHNSNTSPGHDTVDRFIDAKLTLNGLTATEAADPRTFARRLSLVLTGLPPTIGQVDRFVNECSTGAVSEKENGRVGNRSGNVQSPGVSVEKTRSRRSNGSLHRGAVERLADELLSSPHFGEHWGRHWMDVVRFSETHGNEWNYEVHHAWRYRDYLIRAFNNDVPYDQFVREHIAGDLLPNPRWNELEQFNESIIGTGFYRFGEVNHDDCISLRSLGYDLADNQIDTLTKAFQATTVACARCHNHKLDAISSDDYYAMLAILRSSRNVSHCIDSPTVNSIQKRRMKELKRELRQELASCWLDEASQFAPTMRAAHATRALLPGASDLTTGLNPTRLEKWIANLAVESQPLEDPFELWRRLSAVDLPSKADVPPMH